ncbi:hypothetical protein [Methylobacterium sp. JK268]
MKDAAYFRTKAEQCRRLARHLSTQSDPAVTALRAMAAEFDAEALAIEARAAPGRIAGRGGDGPAERAWASDDP